MILGVNKPGSSFNKADLQRDLVRMGTVALLGFFCFYIFDGLVACVSYTSSEASK